MSYAHKDIKRMIFYNKLKKSDILNEWINNNLFMKFFNKTGQNIKAGLVYGLHYLKTNDDYNLLLLQKQQEQQSILWQQKQQQEEQSKQEQLKEEQSKQEQ